MVLKINIKYILLILSTLYGNYVAAKKAKVYTECLKPGQFALTFDDGPNLKTTPTALDVLNRYNIKGTFFINAHNWSDLDNDPKAIELVKKIYKEGHDIGSHTYKHRDLFTALQEGSLKENVDKMTDKIEDIIGVKPAYFRPPSGHGGHVETDPFKEKMVEEIQEYLGRRGYNIIMWSTDTRDWEYKEDINKIIESLNEQLTSPNVSPKTHSFITLFHDVYPSTVDIVLPTVIEYIRSLGYTFVSLSECIGISPYQIIDNNNNNFQSNENDINNNNNNTNSIIADDSKNNNNNSIIKDSGSTSSNVTSSDNYETAIINNKDIDNESNSTSHSDIKKEINNKADSTSDAIIINYSIFINILMIVLLFLF
eukprot:jgi/Orpsp1_1/1182430/evm.model.c7180000081236.2